MPVAPHCDVHTFDPGFYANQVDANATTYHQWGLAAHSGVRGRMKHPMYPLSKMMQLLNHTHIDVLKVDIEGHEFNVFPSFLGRVVPKQVLVEVHSKYQGASTPGLASKLMGTFFGALLKHGFLVFHFEPLLWMPPHCPEVSLIHASALPRPFRECVRSILGITWSESEPRMAAYRA